MDANILITGGSGYLGGDLLSQLASAGLPPHGTVYGLVRSDDQARKVREHYGGVEPLALDLHDEAEVTRVLLEKGISVVFFLINASNSERQLILIRALAQVQRATGIQTHFLHTSGAKLLSGLVGMPVDRPFADSDDGLVELLKGARCPPAPMLTTATDTNVKVVETAEQYNVRAYIFLPCIVYGQSASFGNAISIQTVAAVRAFVAVRKVFDVNEEGAVWPVSHVRDNTTLYLQLLRKILAGEPIDHGRNGFYLASSGSVAWRDIYTALGAALAKRGLVDGADVQEVDDAELERAAGALKRPKSWITIEMGGRCALVAKHGREIGWTPKYPPQHILEAADDEVELILQNI